MKRSHSVGYFSSYDRGLEVLLLMWPEIRKAIPDATLDIFYGWAMFDSVWKSNPKMMQWRWQMTRRIFDLKGQGVTEHGRVDHETLAKAMGGIKVWAYPTEFTEINCITALKAQEAGMIPVTTACYALRESVADHKFSLPTRSIYTDEGAQATFIELVADALESDHRVLPVVGVGWEEIAKQWVRVVGDEG